MANTIQWKLIENSQSQVKNKHAIVVGYKPTGMGRINEVAAVIPMYDLRDTDLSGSVSILESGWAAATKLIDPLYVFGLMNSSGKCSCIQDAAIQTHDYQLQHNNTAAFLSSIFNLRQKILTAVLLKSFLAPQISLNVSLFNNALAEISKFNFLTTFFVKQALEKAVMAVIDKTNK